MFGFYVRNSFLDLFGETQVNFILNSPIFNKDVSIIPGSFSVPVNIPLTDHNRLLLGYPDRIENYNKLSIIEEVSFYVEGVQLFTGKLYVQRSKRKTASVSLLINGLAELQNKKLTELNLGTYTFNTESEVSVKSRF